MHVTMRDFDGCPNWQTAEERLREALERLRRADVTVSRERVDSVEQADAPPFRGSPTVLVDGRDPFAEPREPVGLPCRVSVTDAGLAGAPTVERLVEALGG